MSRVLPLLGSGKPLVMGILNVTPDSFSDGGRFLAAQQAVDHAHAMLAAGADIIDIGGESTRPGAPQVPADEELERVMPVIEALRREGDIPISLDTRKKAVMAEAAGLVDMINDVGALRDDGALELIAGTSLPVCLMHMQGEPGTMQDAPHYDDVLEEVRAFFVERVTACEQAGIGRNRVILDVGFGFGKLPGHNLTLLNRLRTFSDLGLPLLVGLSRKSTIGKIVDDRLIGSVAGAVIALVNGARILRVHDVAETVSAVKVWQAVTEEQISPG